jgi:proton glutamate symport protein
MIRKFLTHPITVMASILLGVLLGIYEPQFSLRLEGVGGVYLSLLKVVVMPFLLATILVGVVGLLQKEGAASMIKRIILGFVISMMLSSAVGVSTVLITSGEITAENRSNLGSLVTSKDAGTDLNVSLLSVPPPPVPTNPFAMFAKFIPENIFASLDMGESLKVVVFCLIFGVALGQVQGSGLQFISESLKAIQYASIHIFKFLNYFLPFALLAMISSQVARVGVGIFGTMLEFIMQQALGGVLILVFSTLVLWWRSKVGVLHLLSTVKDTVIVAISSRSSLACIPYAQNALEKLRYDSSSVELLVPLSFTVNRIGSICYYAISTLFIARIYGIDPGMAGMGVVLLGSILAGLASAGTTGVLTVATVAIVCDLLRLPYEAVIVLLIAVDPVMDMIRTASHVYGNVAVTSFVCDKTATDS